MAIKLSPHSSFLLMCRHRSTSVWSRLSGNLKPESVNEVLSEDDHPLTPSQHLEKLTQKHMPACSWSTPFYNTTVKAQILLSCESVLKQKIPDSQLGSILTINDLLSFLETKKTKQNPYTIFPNVDRARSKGKLPSNLSFPKVTTQSKSSLKPTRDPFQNFSSPEHAKFLTKQQKEARKKKRRHLTAWK